MKINADTADITMVLGLPIALYLLVGIGADTLLCDILFFIWALYCALLLIYEVDPK